MSASATAIDTVLALENAVLSQLREPVVAPNIVIECYQDGDNQVWTIFADDAKLEHIGGPAPSLVQAAMSIGRKRA